ncbi:NAD(P)/FAD-dependent oxidoreductase [Candidatus Phycosocius spiralis]|uniref:Ferredoxin reductase n=1 Tax=Candidatus Phycosocius spiralis TaxID=2815099 RepID=A0ABQ4PUA6_9PROT|nr:FAD-dependent oxidoreductase [Candidatus Phycosocius spiralis]GIU66596.1 ferredoxin reductase [Candidatus Phycosocius spiralis]
MVDRIVIIGAGQAAAQAAHSLRAGDYQGRLVMLGNEGLAPYQRPPLSKAYLSGATGLDRITLKPQEFWDQEHVETYFDVPATELDRVTQVVKTSDGQAFHYDVAIIATGSSVRRLSCPGAELAGVHYLRNIGDADGLRENFLPGKKLVIIGGGYIGLEVAAIAIKAGLEVTILEAATRMLARVAPPVISTFFEDLHRQAGVTMLNNVRIAALVGDKQVRGVKLEDGQIIAAHLVLVAIGIVPNAQLAQAAGLSASDGIETDLDARTSDPHIYAIGDCASRPLVHYDHRRSRLESVHNALEQAKFAAASILGLPRPVEEVPWFWSDQYDIKLQIVGLSMGATQSVVRGDAASRQFAVFHLDGANRLLAVDAINMPPAFMVGKQIIARQGHLAPARLADMSISMKEIGAGA